MAGESTFAEYSRQVEELANFGRSQILRIREVGEDYQISLRLASGAPRTYSYSELMDVFEDRIRGLEGRRSRAEYEIERYSEPNPTDEPPNEAKRVEAINRISDLAMEIAFCNTQIELNGFIKKFFFKKVQDHKAGLIDDLDRPMVDGTLAEGLLGGRQGTRIDRFDLECQRFRLAKGETIPRNLLYEISKIVGIPNLPEDPKSFKDGDKAYAVARQYASLKGYTRIRPRERT